MECGEWDHYYILFFFSNANAGDNDYLLWRPFTEPSIGWIDGFTLLGSIRPPLERWYALCTLVFRLPHPIIFAVFQRNLAHELFGETLDDWVGCDGIFSKCYYGYYFGSAGNIKYHVSEISKLVT